MEVNIKGDCGAGGEGGNKSFLKFTSHERMFLTAL